MANNTSTTTGGGGAGGGGGTGGGTTTTLPWRTTAGFVNPLPTTKVVLRATPAGGRFDYRVYGDFIPFFLEKMNVTNEEVWIGWARTVIVQVRPRSPLVTIRSTILPW